MEIVAPTTCALDCAAGTFVGLRQTVSFAATDRYDETWGAGWQSPP